MFLIFKFIYDSSLPVSVPTILTIYAACSSVLWIKLFFFCPRRFVDEDCEKSVFQQSFVGSLCARSKSVNEEKTEEETSEDSSKDSKSLTESYYSSDFEPWNQQSAEIFRLQKDTLIRCIFKLSSFLGYFDDPSQFISDLVLALAKVDFPRFPVGRSGWARFAEYEYLWNYVLCQYYSLSDSRYRSSYSSYRTVLIIRDGYEIHWELYSKRKIDERKQQKEKWIFQSSLFSRLYCRYGHSYFGSSKLNFPAKKTIFCI